MKLKSYWACVAMVGLLLAGCGAGTEPAPAPGPEPAAGQAAPDGDPLSGRWTGDWGPSANDRNPVVLDLTWNGTQLSGIVNPGPNAVPLTSATFDPATGTVTMQADAETPRGTFQYMIEGRLDGRTMTGSWGHDAVSGDFTIMMESAQ